MTSSRVASAPVAWQRCLFDQWAKHRERERKGIGSWWKREGKIGRRAPSFPFFFLPPLSFPAAGFISTHYSTHRQALGTTLIGPSNRRVSLLPLKGASLVSEKPPFCLWNCRACSVQDPSSFLLLLHLLEDSGALERENFNICFRSEIVCARPWLFALDFIGVPTSLEISKVQRNINFRTLAKLFFEDTNLGNQANKNRKTPSSLHAFPRQLRLSPRNYRALIILVRPLILRKLCSMLEPKFMTRNCTYATADSDDKR